MNSKNQMEDAVRAEMLEFQRDHLGRGPKNIDCYLLRDMLVLRLQDILTPAERQLAGSDRGRAGRILLRQLRVTMIDASRPTLEAMVKRATGAGVLCLHHDISPENGEEVFLFSLASAPGPA